MSLRSCRFLLTLAVCVGVAACGDLPSAPATPEAVTTTATQSISPLAVDISGPDYIYGEGVDTYTWTANVRGGSSPYSYQWQIRLEGDIWRNAGTGSSYTRQVHFAWGHPSFTLRLVVTSAGSTASDEQYVELLGPPMCGGVLC